MKVLLSGANGFIGRHVYDVLRSRDIEVDTLQHGADIPVREFDIFIHSAGVVPSRTIGVSSGLLYDGNVSFTTRVAQYVNTKRIIFLSSTSVYGQHQGSVITESSPTVNPSVYGIAKREGENILLKSHPNVLILRLPTIIGNNASPNFFSRMVDGIVDGKPFTVTNLTTPFNSLYYVDYLAKLIGDIVFKDWRDHHVFNMAPDNPITLGEIINLISYNYMCTTEFFEFANQRSADRISNEAIKKFLSCDSLFSVKDHVLSCLKQMSGSE